MEYFYNLFVGTFLQLKSYSVCIILVISVVILLVLSVRRKNGLPPGPALLPVIGNIHKLSPTNIFHTLKTLRHEYGDIYSLYIGSEVVVVINGFRLVHEAMVRHGAAFQHRPPSVNQKLGMTRTGIIYSNGDRWREQKTFLVKNMQTMFLSNGAQKLEYIVHTELDELLKDLEQNCNVDFDISDFIHTVSLNVMFNITYGQRFSRDDHIFQTFVTSLHEAARHVARMQLLANCFPFLTALPGDWLGSRKRLQLADTLHTIARGFDNFNDNSQEHVSLFDAFNKEIKNHSCDKESSFNPDQREDTLIDFIAAGETRPPRAYCGSYFTSCATRIYRKRCSRK